MPLYFPQLRPGSAMQYPLGKRTRYRTVVNEPDLVSDQRSADEGGARVQWDLQLRGLSDDEVQSIQSLYHQVRGAHGEFVFLDPDGNLLSHSEDLVAGAWQSSPGLTLTTASTHPPPANQAWRLSSLTGQPAEIWQAGLLPAHFYWLLSVYARADSPAEISLLLRSTFGEQTRTVSLTSEWRRYWYGGMWWPEGEGIDVGVRIGAGTTAEVTALQLETQLAPSAYKPTKAVTGVYSKARFANEALDVTSLAPQCHQLQLRIEAPL